jgi:hypothetical protein
MTKFLFCFLFLLVGCVAQLTGSQAQHMTSEQIKEYKDNGFDVYSCFQIGGPPPAGATTFLIVPSGTKVDFQFSPNCQLLVGKING